jgi:hypothetical protein
MRISVRLKTVFVASALVSAPAAAQQAAPARPADGYSIHVSAPHMYQGREMGPVHHFCKPITQDPIIVCLLYDTMDPNAPLAGVEYIVAKSLTRASVPLGTWNQNFHDHTVEIATGRVKVLDMPEADARKVAELVATTDGIIFHLWPMGDAFPTGTVVIDQSVGHKPLTAAEYAGSAPRSNPR